MKLFVYDVYFYTQAVVHHVTIIQHIDPILHKAVSVF
jgi:hypothetical protein